MTCHFTHVDICVKNLNPVLHALLTSIIPGMKDKNDELQNLQDNTADVEIDQSSSGKDVEEDTHYRKNLLEKEYVCVQDTLKDHSTPVDYSSPARILVIERQNRSKEINKHAQASVEVFVPQREVGDEAVVVWDAALVLSYYLEKHQLSLELFNDTNPPHVVDVGAGTGAVGLVAASLGANVTLTDLPRTLPLLEEGVKANNGLLYNTSSTNGKRFIRALPLNWGNISEVHELCKKKEINGTTVGGPPDLIVISDCVYFEDSLAPLICTLRELAKLSKENVQILLSYEVRDYSAKKKKIKEDFFALAERYFSIQEIPTKDCHREYASDDIKLIKMTLMSPKK